MSQHHNPKVHIKAVGFDLGGVVLTSNQPHLYRYLAGQLGVDIYALAAAIDHHRAAFEAGSIEPQVFWERVCAELHVALPSEDITSELWTHGFLEQTVVRPEVLKLADNLVASGYKVGMFTNISHPVDLLDEGRGIFEHFPVVLKSYQLGLVKPQPEAFELLAQKLEVATSELVFIDDIGVNIDGANAAGATGIQYGDFEQVVRQLNELGVATGGRG